MRDPIYTVLDAILFASEGQEPLGGVDFHGLGETPAGRRLASLGARLAGRCDRGADQSPAAAGDGNAARGNDEVESFLETAAERTLAELSNLQAVDSAWRLVLEDAAEAVRTGYATRWGEEARALLWEVFFPEGARLLGRTEAAIADLRARRGIEIQELNDSPLSDPVSELLVTSNVLLTVPHTREEIDALPHGDDEKHVIRRAFEEEQRYFYDHPIHIGTPPENNEAIYGLRGLNDAVAWEKEHRGVEAHARLTVVLSLSVTHDGLHEVGRKYLAEEIRRAGALKHLDVYLFTEVDCRRIVEDVLAPHLPAGSIQSVVDVFGVDGEYGRHYSFLKATAAFWQVFVDPRIRATFKIDLDQVFPQRELSEQTGASAFEHFMTPLWGSRGVDCDGNEVELGMIAGALVNEKDIGSGVYTPDVPFPEEIPAGEAAVFFNKLPMAVSTRAEMMTRYEGPGGADAPNTDTGIDGRAHCIERVHVTGGTNGILVDHLRRYRPFTPSFIGRAEDQAYILSVLYDGEQARLLRYVHEPGLIMRHDKDAFAGESIAAARTGRFIGDLARTYYFTRYAGILPWGLEWTKSRIDPFTGCFVTRRCYAIIVLRLALHAAHLIAAGEDEEASQVLRLAARKLGPLFEDPAGERVRRRYLYERSAWHSFYDALRRAEAASSDTVGAAESVVAPAHLELG
ncbi:MAG: hypothetical protein GVY23_06640 [Spirochaetes bacterium]|nr:hypothetical protein [Spirochaetota bacterium]